MPTPGKEQTTWDGDLDRAMAELLVNGKTYSDIAKEFGTSRSTIAGRVHRLKAAGKLESLMRKTAPKLRHAKAPMPAPIGIPELMSWMCRWPQVKAGEPTTFCGERQVPGFPYCEAHLRVAYRPASEQPRKSTVRPFVNSKGHPR